MGVSLILHFKDFTLSDGKKTRVSRLRMVRIELTSKCLFRFCCYSESGRNVPCKFEDYLKTDFHYYSNIALLFSSVQLECFLLGGACRT